MHAFLNNIYRCLYSHFGPQKWWPTTTPNSECPGYVIAQPVDSLSSEEQWEIMVGAILTQNTAWHNVELALIALQANQALELQKLAGLSLQTLSTLIRPSGYFNQKAQRLHTLANHLVQRTDGNITLYLKRPGPVLRNDLLTFKGIGPETADAILLYAGHQPFFVIDAYTRRILCRLGLNDLGRDYYAWQKLFMDNLPADAVLFNEYHALLVKHAITYCRVKPRCTACCLRAQCKYSNKI